jgi:cellulose synthase/poly-beta-1,6-N-acetylglucosamine synthase-like glycosyltransferase
MHYARFNMPNLPLGDEPLGILAAVLYPLPYITEERSFLMTLIALLYGIVAIVLAFYGFRALCLTVLFLRHRHQSVLPPPAPSKALPFVTVQLPIYNEKYVVTRLIDAVCTLQYPSDRLEIQILDDSTDDTVEIAARRIAYWQRRGRLVEHVRREDRKEYKAGALTYGLERAKGEYIAIFDADFVPTRDWLIRTVAHYCQPGSEKLGLVQTRWSHLNEEFSALTRAQAVMLDGHFGVEQVGRSSSGLFMNFNGTAGLWRRDAIIAAGGWSGDTLAEDLDLSYRAQLAGWSLRFDGTIDAPAEIPAQITAFKQQQYRWAKGSMQVARHKLVNIIKSEKKWYQKLGAFFHLTGYVIHPLMVVALLLNLPLLYFGWPHELASYQVMLGWIGIAGLAAPVMYGLGQWQLYGAEWHRRYRWLPLVVLLGTGVALSNGKAVLEGLFGQKGGEFRRTPKFGQDGRWQGRTNTYTALKDSTAFGELFLSAYALLCCVVAVHTDQWFALPFLMIYLFGFGWVGYLSLSQAAASQRKPATVKDFADA